ncbi:hypothetical protein AAEX28_08245 [Lentisphaerota bacterium WC36G]|nr:hypothetical protein LJT99_11100 [Lentisphaerae bacterium WC36]
MNGFLEIFSFFVYPFLKVYDLWMAWISFLKFDGLFPNVLLIIIALIIAGAWSYSGCLCSGIAQRKMRDPLIHYILGMVMPFFHVGSLKLLATKDEAFAEIADIKAQKEQDLKAELTSKFTGGAEYMERAQETETVEEEVEESVEYDRDFFESLIYSETGYTAILKNGRVIEIEMISEIGDDYIMVDVLNTVGELQRLRLVYRMMDVFTVRENFEDKAE